MQLISSKKELRIKSFLTYKEEGKETNYLYFFPINNKPQSADNYTIIMIILLTLERTHRKLIMIWLGYVLFRRNHLNYKCIVCPYFQQGNISCDDVSFFCIWKLAVLNSPLVLNAAREQRSWLYLCECPSGLMIDFIIKPNKRFVVLQWDLSASRWRHHILGS